MFIAGMSDFSCIASSDTPVSASKETCV